MSGLDGLDQACPVCGRTSGDHTLREWAQCLDTPTTNLPFQTVPADMAAAAGAAIRDQFSLDPDLIVTDTVVVKAATLAGSTGTVGIRIPALLHEFQIGLPAAPPETVAKVAFIGGDEAMRAYGRLVRDSANGAANAARNAA